MWIDYAGVAHTAALPDPADVMSDDFRAGIDAIVDSDPDALQGVISSAEERFFDAGWLELSRSPDYVGVAPPVGLLRGRVLSAADVADAIDQTDLRCAST